MKVAILGASGRMGSTIGDLLKKEYADRIQIVGQASAGDSFESLFSAEVVIDFSNPTAFEQFTKAAASKPKIPRVVTGTTGWTEKQWVNVENLAAKTPLLYSSNYSVGVFLLKEIVRIASPRLKEAGYSPVLMEAHHIHKKDSPSGTAKTLQSAIDPKNPAGVQTHSVRAGEIIGDHEFTFIGQSDKLVFGHFAQDRSLFARGAIEAALWLQSTSTAAGKVIGMDTFFNERYGKL